jgi:glutamate synthase domain-containing protein 2
MDGLQKTTNQKVVAGKPVNNMIKLSSLINEVEVGQGHENDRDMVVGVAEILRMVDDMNNRKEIAEAMLRKFKSEDVIHNAKEFLTLCGISS